MNAAAMGTTQPAIDSESTRGGQGLIRSLRFLAAMILAAAIFWYVGWWAAKPIDPGAPVTLLLARQGVVTMAELLGLSIVAGALAVAVCGAGSAHRGPLAVAVGLAALGGRGTQMDSLIMYLMHPGAGFSTRIDPFPTWALLAETWLWLALIAVGLVAGRWVESWFDDARPARPAAPAPRDARQIIGAVIVTAALAWILITFSVGGGASRLLKGQIYFSVALGFTVGASVANSIFRAQSPLWMLLAIGLVASAAYLLDAPPPRVVLEAQEAGTYVPLPTMVRPLPLEYAALGAAGVLCQEDTIRLLRSLLGLGESHRG